MRYEEVLQQAINLLNEGINEGKIIKEKDEEDSSIHDNNSEQITWIIEEVISQMSDEGVLEMAKGMPELYMRTPSLDADWDSRYEMSCPMAYMRENLYEILLDDVWDKFDEEAK